jgi:hypothetical protein
VTLNTGRLGFPNKPELSDDYVDEVTKLDPEVIAQLALQHRHAFAEREC